VVAVFGAHADVEYPAPRGRRVGVQEGLERRVQQVPLGLPRWLAPSLMATRCS
jgi:hypothetical protein